jgi:ATP-binding cassette, subfamily B, bacterial MsbA
LRLFRRFDRRLAAELKTQRRTIVQGLLCVLVTSLLTVSIIPLLQLTLQAVEDAGKISSQHLLPNSEVTRIAKELGRSPKEVNNAVAEVETSRNPAGGPFRKAEEARLAAKLEVSQADVARAIGGGAVGAQGPPNSPSGRLKAMGRQKAAVLKMHLLPEKPVDRIGVLALLIVAIYGVKYWFTRGQVYFLSKAAARLAANLRIRMFDKLQRLPISYFNEKRSGAIQSVLTNDVNVYQTAVTIIRDSIDGPTKAIGAFATIVYLQWQLALVICLFMPVMAWAIQRNARKMRVAQKRVQEDLAGVGAMTQEALMGTRVVKAFAAEDRITSQYGELVEQSYKSQVGAVRRLAALRPMVELIGAAGLAAVVYICGRLASGGLLVVADIAAIVYALDVINQGVRCLGSVNNTFAQVQAASERIYGEILDVPDAHTDEHGKRELPKPTGRIEFENVSFAYPDGTKALNGVSFVLESGSSLALVGPSGAGKSTIGDLLLRFYDPTEGRILFDGVDIRELKVSWLRNQIGVVPQQTFLFAGSISDNIRLGAPDASDEEVTEAARAGNADAFIAQMPERYGTELGERGVRVSGGEMQRIAIARALVRKPTLLLLDEATSNLDAVSEKAVQEALDRIMKERSTLFIAHRLTTAARAERIVMLRRGEIIESGTHRQLMELGGAYAGMYSAFSSGVLDDAII